MRWQYENKELFKFALKSRRLFGREAEESLESRRAGPTAIQY